ncbi:hypothetical protein J6590_070208 [Homalodisca vitripennis]|nr:hypothetical protein J6590_070208 [Homalodisca vitripennis]
MEEVSLHSLTLETPPGKVPSQEDDALCTFCEDKLSAYTRGELWVRCALCELWGMGIVQGQKKTYGFAITVSNRLNINSSVQK